MFRDGTRIDALEWLIEKEHARVVQQGHRQGALLPHAKRRFLDSGGSALYQIEVSQQLNRPGVGFLAVQAVKPAAQFEVLPDRQIREEGIVFRQDADLPAQLEIFERHHAAGHPRLSCRGSKQAGQQFDGGRFAGSIGTKEGEDRAAGHLQGDAAYRRHRSKRLGETARFNRPGFPVSRHRCDPLADGSLNRVDNQYVKCDGGFSRTRLLVHEPRRWMAPSRCRVRGDAAEWGGSLGRASSRNPSPFTGVGPVSSITCRPTP